MRNDRPLVRLLILFAVVENGFNGSVESGSSFVSMDTGDEMNGNCRLLQRTTEVHLDAAEI